MKKLVLMFLALICFTTFIGCQKTDSNTTELVYESFSEKEQQLLNITGNKVLMYKLNNIPGDKKYKILLTYEFYKNGEKVKEEIIAAIMQEEPSGKSDDTTIGVNLQGDKIRYIIDNGSGSYDVKEDLNQTLQAFLNYDVNLTIGTEVYIYYATSSNVTLASSPLGVPIDSNVTKDLLKDGESTILIKLSFKEI